MVNQPSPQAALRSQASAKQPLGGGKPTSPTKFWSMIDMQSYAALNSITLGTQEFDQPGREGNFMGSN